MTKRLLSKSSINLYLQCPLKWKFVYIDKIPSIPSIYQKRGTKIHEKIEGFYKNIKIVDNKIIYTDEDLKNFVDFENKRLKNCKDLRYFKPLFQELKLQDEKLGLKGIIDAVYINSDDGTIIIDWKTGKFDESKLDDYRFELALYAELLRASNKVDNIKYWGIYFIDADKLFFEQIKLKYIIEMYETVGQVRQEIEQKCFEPCPNQYCYNCQFRNKCNGDKK